MTLPFGGPHAITLTVDDGKGGTDTDQVNISIVDTTPPEFAVSLSPNQLWPPNHKMKAITATVSVDDICDTSPTFTLVSITSNEPDNGPGDGDTPNDIQDADYGTADTSFKLRAERSGTGNGRIYEVTYSASDASGNSVSVTDTVFVPKNKSKKTSSGEEKDISPSSFTLFQNYPNLLIHRPRSDFICRKRTLWN